MFKKFLVFICVALPLLGWADEQCGSLIDYQWLHEADPTVDIEEAISLKDFRFMAMNGVGLSIPTATGFCQQKKSFVRENMYKIIFSGHVFKEYAEHRNQALASAYAGHYNMLMLQRLAKLDLLDSVCDS